MRRFISEYFSPDGERVAKVVEDKGWWVELWQNGSVVEYRNLNGHSEQYAQDCAENWAEGIIE